MSVDEPTETSGQDLGAIAAIDIGTNSIHTVLARVLDRGRYEVLTREKATVRLGSGGGDMDTLDADAIDRGIAALTRAAQLAVERNALVVAVATSAVREASNSKAFIRRARDEAGVSVEVISGVEEARLIHLGVLGALPVFDRPHALIDIGGGSTEVLYGTGDEVTASRSFKLGAIRTTRRFFPDGLFGDCLLYTSDAADERSSVDLGGRRIIKKKKN